MEILYTAKGITLKTLLHLARMERSTISQTSRTKDVSRYVCCCYSCPYLWKGSENEAFLAFLVSHRYVDTFHLEKHLFLSIQTSYSC